MLATPGAPGCSLLEVDRELRTLVMTKAPLSALERRAGGAPGTARGGARSGRRRRDHGGRALRVVETEA